MTAAFSEAGGFSLGDASMTGPAEPTPTPDAVPVVPGTSQPADPTTGQPVPQPPADQPSGVEHPTLPSDRNPRIEPVAPPDGDVAPGNDAA